MAKKPEILPFLFLFAVQCKRLIPHWRPDIGRASQILSDQGRSQLSHPDVPEPHGIAVILQNDRPFTMLGVAWEDGFVSGRPEDFRVVLDEDAVVEDGDRGFLLDPSVVA